MLLVRKLVYTTDEAQLEKQYSDLLSPTCMSNAIYTRKYPQLIKRLKIFWKRRSEWALSYRVAEFTRGNNTNNYAEAGIRVLKEIIFGRVKAYNLVQMFDFITATMEVYYAGRLLDIAHSRYKPGLNLRYRELSKSTLNIVKMKQVRDSTYIVEEDIPNIGLLEYVTDMELGTCSCTTGCTGAACRHQAALAKKFEVKTINMPPLHDKQTRHMLAILAHGKQHVLEIDFYADLLESHTGKKHSNTEYTMKHELGPQPLKDTCHTQEDDDHGLQTHDRTRYKQLLNEIVEDLSEKMDVGDHNLISGVSHFIQTYTKLKSSHSPDSAISYALHNFGKSDRKLNIYIYIYTMYTVFTRITGTQKNNYGVQCPLEWSKKNSECSLY